MIHSLWHRLFVSAIAVEKVTFGGRVVLLGFGTVGQGLLSLLLRHFEMSMAQVTVVDAQKHRAQFARFARLGICYLQLRLTPDNLTSTLQQLLSPGDLLINLTVGVDSITILDWCQIHDILYVDSSIEPWADQFEDIKIPLWKRTHYFFHQTLRHLAKTRASAGATAIVAHGANPGLVSHFVKAALLDIASIMKLPQIWPTDQTSWATMSRSCGVKVIQISERDTQISSRPKQLEEFVNTWSIWGFLAEAYYPAEIGWGTHEKHLPENAACFEFGSGNAIYLQRPGGATYIRSWLPLGGAIEGLLLSHSETITISDYFSLWQDGQLLYRPTVNFAYHPTNDAIASLREVMMRGGQPHEKLRVLNQDIVTGRDELGVLLLGHPCNGWWYGSQLSIEEARQILPGHNATTVQVCAGVIAAAVWAVRHPQAGFREPEQLPHNEILQIARPYLGRMVSVPTNWTPLQGRCLATSPYSSTLLFPEPWLDWNDPWQFDNFLVR
ncbi:MAG: saccharopine dehydrogenase C-terminal domain-containing protein [Nostoc sp.]|uniref:saccharopine dehydrogenase C-terminal domain-containing protein n=1 Tax=Nostoc sp. TaxID=1180 RepID=UPI002FF76C67